MKLCKVDGCDRLARSTEGYCNKHDIQMRRHGKITDSQLTSLSGEIWKDIKGHEGKYKVSNKGRVVSLHKGVRELKPQKCSHKKGVYVTLGSHDANKTCLSSLVAKYFLPKSQVNDTLLYLDGDENNCSADNLAWSSNYLLPLSVAQLQIETTQGYDDAHSVLSFIAGDTEAISPVVEKYRTTVVNVVSSTLNHRGIPSAVVTADDIAQETFIKAFTLMKVGKLSSVAKLKGWLNSSGYFGSS